MFSFSWQEVAYADFKSVIKTDPESESLIPIVSDQKSKVEKCK